ncbi:midkine [Rhynochetos jubatus]
MQIRGLLFLLALILLAATTEAGKNKKEKAKKDGSECEDWRWGPCVPNSKDCGLGYREGTCKEESKKLKCKIPCNWKKKFGADCKYKFESWGGCSAQTGVKTRSGILKKALYNAQCEEIVYVTKPCSSKIKSKSKARVGAPQSDCWVGGMQVLLGKTLVLPQVITSFSGMGISPLFSGADAKCAKKGKGKD